jgi:hypothetical protein
VFNRNTVNNTLLRTIGVIVEFPAKLPASMVVLNEVWEHSIFSRLLDSTKRKGWPPPKQAMFSKWKFLHLRIKARADNGGFKPAITETAARLIASAERFDEERGERSMDAFRSALTKNDIANGVKKGRPARGTGI